MRKIEQFFGTITLVAFIFVICCAKGCGDSEWIETPSNPLPIAEEDAGSCGESVYAATDQKEKEGSFIDASCAEDAGEPEHANSGK